jgi:ferritin-like metal-binding protein YciE
MENLIELLVEELKDLYSAEKQIIKRSRRSFEVPPLRS